MRSIVSRARLRLDILSMKALVWLLGRDGELFDSHLFFCERYSELADLDGAAGRAASAARCAAIH